MQRIRSILVAATAALAAASVGGQALANGPLGLHHGWRHGGWAVGMPMSVTGGAAVTSPLSTSAVMPTMMTSPLSTASFGTTTASFGTTTAATGHVLYYTTTAVPATMAVTHQVTSPLSAAGFGPAMASATVSAPAAAPIVSPLSGAGAGAGVSDADVSLAGVDVASILDEYNRFAEQERQFAASRAGVGLAGISVQAAELNDLAANYAQLAQAVGGANNLHGLLRFLRTKATPGNQAQFRQTARGLFGEVLGGALREAPQVALKVFGPALDAMIRQYIPGFSLFSQLPGGGQGGLGGGNGGPLVPPGSPGSSPNNPIYLKLITPGGVAEPANPDEKKADEKKADDQAKAEPGLTPQENALLQLLRENVKEFNVAEDGTITGVKTDGQKFRIPKSGIPEPVE